MTECESNKGALNAQQRHWNDIYSEDPEFFGEEPSYPARKAAEILSTENKIRVLELGAGQGRDALFFAKNHFQVYALDYSEKGVEAINLKAQKQGLSDFVTAICHDLRKPFPFEDESFDACYCHMLYCMALCTGELEVLFREVRRVLRPNGLSIFSVRNKKDPHYGKGIPRGDDMYENCGFIVHFFSREEVEYLSKGYKVVDIEEFEEGELPKRLFLVRLRKL